MGLVEIDSGTLGLVENKLGTLGFIEIKSGTLGLVEMNSGTLAILFKLFCSSYFVNSQNDNNKTKHIQNVHVTALIPNSPSKSVNSNHLF